MMMKIGINHLINYNYLNYLVEGAINKLIMINMKLLKKKMLMMMKINNINLKAIQIISNKKVNKIYSSNLFFIERLFIIKWKITICLFCL